METNDCPEGMFQKKKLIIIISSITFNNLNHYDKPYKMAGSYVK